MNTAIQQTLIKWNTGRTYTEHGQRLAAVAFKGGVILADYDRCLEYWLPDCELLPSAIMARYDANDRTEYRPKEMDVIEFVALRDWLVKQAAGAPSMKPGNKPASDDCHTYSY